MLTWWSAQVVRWRKAVMIGAGLFLVFAIVWGTGVFSALVDGGFDVS